MLHDHQRKRYSRHLALVEIGQQGQEALLDAKVAVVGAGGLGAPLLLYLASAGVGTLGVIDADRIELSNLPRQILYETSDVGRKKTSVVMKKLKALNPDCQVVGHNVRLDETNASAILASYDIVADASDNFATRFLVHRMCYDLRLPLIAGAVIEFDGYLSTFKAYLGSPHPCYECFCPLPPKPDLLPLCTSGGVLNSVAGTIATMQATEIIKEILQKGDGLSGRILRYHGLQGQWKQAILRRNPLCTQCEKSNGKKEFNCPG